MALNPSLVQTLAASLKKSKDLDEVKDVLSRGLINPGLSEKLKLYIYSAVYSAAGSYVIDSVSFTPQLVLLLTIDSSDGNLNICIGADIASQHMYAMIHTDGTMVYSGTAYSARVYRDGSNNIQGVFDSFSKGGGTFTTTLTGTCSMEVKMLFVG